MSKKKKILCSPDPLRYSVTWRYNRPNEAVWFEDFDSEEECREKLVQLQEEHDSGKNPLRFVSIKATQYISFEEK